MRVARRAGSAHAVTATAARIPVTAIRTTGSAALTPNSWLSRLRRSAIAPAPPSAKPPAIRWR